MTRRHWTDGLSDAAIRAELADLVREDAAQLAECLGKITEALSTLEREMLGGGIAELSEWFPPSLKRVDEHIEGTQRWGKPWRS